MAAGKTEPSPRRVGAGDFARYDRVPLAVVPLSGRSEGESVIISSGKRGMYGDLFEARRVSVFEHVWR